MHGAYSIESNRSSTGLDNTTINLISALEREADFIYSTVETYMIDARKENEPQAEEIWKNNERRQKEANPNAQINLVKGSIGIRLDNNCSSQDGSRRL